MLENYKDSQSTIYNIFSNAISNNKLSHAYLIDSNGNSNATDIALSFAKMIVCSDLKEAEKEDIVRRIDDGNYLDIKVIEADGMWIKKDELINLQSEFSKRAIEGKKKIYIIKEAEKMNVMTSNSLLKFLEEPIDDIIAILVVNNINLLLPTIISRCQIVKLSRSEYGDNSVENFYNLFSNSKYGKISGEEISVIIDNIIKFILFLEDNGLDTIIYAKNLWHNNFKDRESSAMALELVVCFYEDTLKYKCSIDNLFFKDRIDDVIKVSNSNDIDSLSRKISIIINSLNNIKFNLNINLLIDKIVIDMCGDN